MSHKYTPKRHVQTKKLLENSKKNSLPAASGSIISPTYHCRVHKQLCRGK